MADLVGSITAFAGPIENVAQNWLPCDGRRLIRSEFPELFAAIGTCWGGDGNPSFSLPDLSGLFLRGVDRDINGAPCSPPHDPDSGVRGPSSPSDPNHHGNAGNAVGSKQSYATALPGTPFGTNQFGNHTHLDPTWNGQSGPFELAVGDARGPGGSDFVPPNQTSASGQHAHAVTQGGDRETRPVNAYVYWIIKVKPE